MCVCYDLRIAHRDVQHSPNSPCYDPGPSSSTSQGNCHFHSKPRILRPESEPFTPRNEGFPDILIFVRNCKELYFLSALHRESLKFTRHGGRKGKGHLALPLPRPPVLLPPWDVHSGQFLVSLSRVPGLCQGTCIYFFSKNTQGA